MSLINAIVLDKLFDELRSGSIIEPGVNHGRGKEYKPQLRYKVQPVHNYLWGRANCRDSAGSGEVTSFKILTSSPDFTVKLSYPVDLHKF